MAPRHSLHRYVQQALHYLDPKHEIFKPGQVLAWHPALDRTTKTLQRLLCVPELVLIVDDSPIAWANHVPNLVLIDRFVGAPTDVSLPRVAEHLKGIHRAYFERYDRPPRSPRSLSVRPSSGLSPFSLLNPAAGIRPCPQPLSPVAESSPQPGSSGAYAGGGVAGGVDGSGNGQPARSAPRSPLIMAPTTAHTASCSGAQDGAPQDGVNRRSGAQDGAQQDGVSRRVSREGSSLRTHALSQGGRSAPRSPLMAPSTAHPTSWTGAQDGAPQDSAPSRLQRMPSLGSYEVASYTSASSALAEAAPPAAAEAAPPAAAEAAPPAAVAFSELCLSTAMTMAGGDGEVAAPQPPTGAAAAVAPSTSSGSSGAGSSGGGSSSSGTSGTSGISGTSGTSGTEMFMPVRPAADVRELLLAQCGRLLSGVACTFVGPSSLLFVDGVVPPEVQLARRCGAAVYAEVPDDL